MTLTTVLSKTFVIIAFIIYVVVLGITVIISREAIRLETATIQVYTDRPQ